MITKQYLLTIYKFTCNGTKKLDIVASTCPTAAKAPIALQASLPEVPLPKNLIASPKTASFSK